VSHDDPELDLARLLELRTLLDRELAEIVVTLVSELSRAFEQMEQAMAVEDLGEAANAAHAARNSALMIDAQPMLAGLAELECSARGDDLARARRAHAHLLELWPRLRERLSLAAAAH
jgi:HPt (histidine-containing phosphotransfer) domain-containing protein